MDQPGRFINPGLSTLLQEYRPPRNLRNSSYSLVITPTANSVPHDQRAFAYSAHALWKPLPNNLKNAISLSSFKTGLETFLFRKLIVS